MNGTNIQLPEYVQLKLTAQDVVTILGALHDTGPYKTVMPVIRNVEQQLLSQQILVPIPLPNSPAPDSKFAEPLPKELAGTLPQIVDEVEHCAHHPV